MNNFAPVFIFILLLFLSCVQREAKTLEAPSEVKLPGTDMKAKDGWEAEWEKAVKGAKKEGKVVLHLGATVGQSLRKEINKIMKSKYDFELEIVAGRATELAEKIIREHKAGLYMTDMYLAGPTSIFYVKAQGIPKYLSPALILPEVTEPKNWFEGRLPFLDGDKTVLSFASNILGELTINTDLVKKEDLQSYRDLLHPKWKGKIAMSDPSIAGPGNLWFSTMGIGVMGIDYLKELAKQDIIFSRDPRQLAEWVAKGKYPVLIGGAPGMNFEMKQVGAPIDTFLTKEGGYVSAAQGNIAVYKNNPHPDATKVFINWLLSKEGQTIYVRGMDYQSARIDVPTDHLDRERILKPGMKYFNSLTEEFQLKQPEKQLLAREIFGIR